jgi:CheY-like chemotaxis protein
MGHRIFIIDDNEALRENLRECLGVEGYDVEEAGDAGQALARLARDPLPHAIILDLMMPGMDGWELTARIRRDPRLAGVRVIVSSGVALSPSARPPEDADLFLPKPYGLPELFEAVRSVCADLAA